MDAKAKIDEMISRLPDWRGDLLKGLRSLIHEAYPELTEEWKWSTPVFSGKGIVCALGSFKDHVKINFFKGAALSDPDHLFDAGLEAKTMRSIDFFEGDKIRKEELKKLIASAFEQNQK